MAELVVPVGDHDHILGPGEAPITLVEYGDFECPHCGAAHPIVKRLLRAEGRRMRLVFRHFPLMSAHPHAEMAAMAAEGAAEQGAFWPFHDTLFEHQDALEEEDLLAYGAALGLNVRRIAAALEDERLRAKVREHFMSGARSGVNGTPTFFINNVRFDGSYLELPEYLRALRGAA